MTSAAWEELREEIINKAVVRGKVILSSGREADYYVDLRRVTLDAVAAPLVGTVMRELTSDWDYVAVGGLTMGADPVAFGVAAVAATRGRDLRSFSVRKEAKDHGVTGRLAGALQPGDKVVIVEDTTTRGTSLLEAVEVVRAFGAEVVLASVIVDRGTTCADLCAADGVAYTPLLTATDLGFEPGT